MRKLDIKQLKIDVEKNILEINEKPFTQKVVIVNLPGPENWIRAMIVNAEIAQGIPGECAELNITFKE